MSQALRYTKHLAYFLSFNVQRTLQCRYRHSCFTKEEVEGRNGVPFLHSCVTGTWYGTWHSEVPRVDHIAGLSAQRKGQQCVAAHGRPSVSQGSFPPLSITVSRWVHPRLRHSPHLSSLKTVLSSDGLCSRGRVSRKLNESAESRILLPLSSKLTGSLQEAWAGIMSTPFEGFCFLLGVADALDVGQGGSWHPDGALRAAVPAWPACPQVWS